MGLPKMEKLWVIQANVVRTDGQWTSSTGVPTFYLDPDIQGILTAEHACRVAMGILDPFDLLEVYVSAIALDTETGLTVESEYATLGPRKENEREEQDEVRDEDSGSGRIPENPTQSP
jgi:hypothetical protein